MFGLLANAELLQLLMGVGNPLKRKKKAKKPMPKKVVARVNKEDMELRRLLAAADRDGLESFVFNLAQEGRVPDLNECIIKLGGNDANKAPAPVQPHNEALADMGLFNAVNRDNLIEILDYIPSVRDRLTCASTVCKTWRSWLRGQAVLFHHTAITLGASGGDREWLDGPGLVRMVTSAPEGAFHSLKLTVDSKVTGVTRKTRIDSLFKPGAPQFTKLRSINLDGGRITSEVIGNIAATCAGNLEEIRLFGIHDENNVPALLRNAPRLRILACRVMSAIALDSVREAILAACPEGEVPVLEEFRDSSSDWSWECRYKPLPETLKLISSFPNLKKLSVKMVISNTDYSAALQSFQGPYEALTDLEIRLGPEWSATEAISAKFNEVFARLASVLPNLKRLIIHRAREFLSQKEIRRGSKYRPAPVLSGHHLLPSLEVLTLSYFELDTELVLDAPNLTKCHLSMPDGRSSTPVLLRLKATCPKLDVDATGPSGRLVF